MPIFFSLFALLLTLPVVWPQVDLVVAGAFYRGGEGFFWANQPVFLLLHWLASDGARVLGIVFVVLAVATKASAARPFSTVCSSLAEKMPAKAWLFLLLALLVGPALVANVGLKDHWGRSRPREVTEFGGQAAFTPALEPHFERARSNGSFVSGDGSFGFFLPAFALVVPRRMSRRVFWGAMGAGCAFAFSRIAMGAHFFSDNVYAAFFMLTSVSGVHAALYGWRETKARWKGFFCRGEG